MKTEINFIGLNSSKEWPHYMWSININGTLFEYKTGVGHATPKRGKGKGIRQTVWESEQLNKKPKDKEVVDAGDSWAHVPKIDEVLECLFLDSQSGTESFNDFCDKSGYSNDSLKALDTYRACMDTGTKLRKVLGSEYESERARIESLNN